MSATRTTERTTGWTGWVAFCGIMLVLLGLFHAVEGLVAVFDKGYYLVAPSGLPVHLSYNVWGWLQVGMGVVAVLVGIGVLAGNTIAQVAGAVFAAASAVVHLLFIAAYPVWAIVIITVDVLIIYALLVHGKEITAKD
ncbi:DUF7144 family membrane protein [Amycolatopsis sp.]|uniref:DUF7144 family membrane protein n=1 Tax=Amycolatopsis sp. TaxID=37632 RepID=UPI002C13C56E|nr:hypothetical protein [Amycolatopsis sp.]HVV14547.1 hypothetical protein [Amycolatopsis sp.]